MSGFFTCCLRRFPYDWVRMHKAFCQCPQRGVIAALLLVAAAGSRAQESSAPSNADAKITSGQATIVVTGTFDRNDAPPSVKVVRTGFGTGNMERLDPRGFHGNHTILILQSAVNDEKSLRGQQQSVLLKQIRRDNRVGNSGFIFQA